MPDLRLFDVMLFDYGTTNRTDFRNGEIKPIVRTVYTEKPGCLRIRPPPLKDIHTLSDWKNPVPSTLLVKPKEIVRTNPKQIQEKYRLGLLGGGILTTQLRYLLLQEAPPDLGRDEAQKTRPRLVMTPAISLDDIIDSQTRNLLIENIYKTTMQQAYSDVPSRSGNLRAPFPGLPAPANPITIEKLDVPYVSPEWRMQSAGWDTAQLRAHCDPCREFYLDRALKCDACKVTAAVTAQRRMMKEMKNVRTQ